MFTLIPLAQQTITLVAGGTSSLIPPSGANWALVQATEYIHFRTDSVVPTTTTGITIPAQTLTWIRSDLPGVRLLAQAALGSTVRVQYFQIGPINDGGGSLTVDGTVALDVATLAALESITATQGTSPWVTSLDAPTLAALESITVQNPGGAAAVNIQDGGNSITIDGSVTATQGTTPWVTSLDAATLTALESITVQNPGGAAAVNIQDGGNSITIDGSVTATQGTTPWVTSLDAPTLAALESITVQNPGGASAVNIQDGGNSITVDGSVTATQGTSPWVVSGTVAATEAKLEDSSHVSGASGYAVWGVRNDANTVLTSTDGDYSPIAVNSSGAIAINDGGNSITVDGTVTATSGNINPNTKSTYVAGAATTLLKTGAGTLVRIIGLNGTTFTLYDNTVAAGTILASGDFAGDVNSVEMGLFFTIGLTLLTTGGTTKITAVYI